jgi:hypothetical protein
MVDDNCFIVKDEARTRPNPFWTPLVVCGDCAGRGLSRRGRSGWAGDIRLGTNIELEN